MSIDESNGLALLKLLTDAIPIGIFLTDIAGRIIGWTGSAEKMLGYPGEKAVGLQFDLLFEASRASTQIDVRATELLGRVSNFKEIGYARRADGSQFLAVFTMDRVVDEQSGVIGYACTVGPV